MVGSRRAPVQQAREESDSDDEAPEEVGQQEAKVIALAETRAREEAAKGKGKKRKRPKQKERDEARNEQHAARRRGGGAEKQEEEEEEEEREEELLSGNVLAAVKQAGEDGERRHSAEQRRRLEEERKREATLVKRKQRIEVSTTGFKHGNFRLVALGSDGANDDIDARGYQPVQAHTRASTALRFLEQSLSSKRRVSSRKGFARKGGKKRS